MNNETETETDTNLVYVYTRQDAINDGIFVDVSQTAKANGFTIPVAITTNLFVTHIKRDDEKETEYRLNVFLLIMANKILNDKTGDSLIYTQVAFNPNDHTDVWVAIEAQSPTDPSPAINIMLPQDY